MDGSSVFTDDVGVVACHFREMIRNVKLVVDNSSIQCAEAAESVAREQNFLFLHIGHHGLRPVEHRSEEEFQSHTPEVDGVAVGNGDDVLLVNDVIPFKHIGCLCITYNFEVRECMEQGNDATRVVRFHVVDYKIVNLHGIVDVLDFGYLLESVRQFYAIDDGCL